VRVRVYLFVVIIIRIRNSSETYYNALLCVSMYVSCMYTRVNGLILLNFAGEFNNKNNRSRSVMMITRGGGVRSNLTWIQKFRVDQIRSLCFLFFLSLRFSVGRGTFSKNRVRDEPRVRFVSLVFTLFPSAFAVERQR
jgi:hypothetical protein